MEESKGNLGDLEEAKVADDDQTMYEVLDCQNEQGRDVTVSLQVNRLMNAKQHYSGQNVFKLTKAQSRDYKDWRDDGVHPQFEQCLKSIGLEFNEEGDVANDFYDPSKEAEDMQAE